MFSTCDVQLDVPEDFVSRYANGRKTPNHILVVYKCLRLGEVCQVILILVCDCSDASPRRSRSSCWTTSAGIKRRIQRFENMNKSPHSRLRAWSADSQDRCELCSFGINGETSFITFVTPLRLSGLGHLISQVVIQPLRRHSPRHTLRRPLLSTLCG